MRHISSFEGSFFFQPLLGATHGLGSSNAQQLKEESPQLLLCYFMHADDLRFLGYNGTKWESKHSAATSLPRNYDLV